MDFKKALAAAKNAVGNVIYYPSKWNPLVGEPKSLDELNFLEFLFIGVRRQQIVVPAFASATGTSVAGGVNGYGPDVDDSCGSSPFDADDGFNDPTPAFDGGTGCFAYNHTFDPTQN